MSTLTRIARHALAIVILSATAWALPPAPVAQAQGCDETCCIQGCVQAHQVCLAQCVTHPYTGCTGDCTSFRRRCIQRCTCPTSPCP